MNRLVPPYGPREGQCFTMVIEHQIAIGRPKAYGHPLGAIFPCILMHLSDLSNISFDG